MRYRNLTKVAIFATALGFATSNAWAAVITLQPGNGKDVEIDTSSPNANRDPSGVAQWLVINWAGNARSIGLLEFDLSAIPAGSTINSATLSLFHELNTQVNARYDIFRVTSAWAESTVTFNTAPTFDPVAAASLVFSGTSGVFRNWDVTALTQGWVSGAFSNFGMWIEEIPVQGTATAYFSSSDTLTVGNEPKLTIDFTAAAPEPAAMLLMGAGLVLSLARRHRSGKSS